MVYSQYGTTGARVSAVGFGGMRFDESRPDAENARLLLYAQSKGINYFDTAPGYCEDHSEDIFGIALKQMADIRDQIYISTKGMPANFNTADKARKAVEKSLKRLNVDKIDFYHVWCIRRMDQYELAMKKGGQYEGLLKCKEEGLIDHIVISTHLQGEQICRVIEKKEFEGVLLGANILNFQYRWQGVQAAFGAGLGVVAMNPLAGGIIPKYQKQLAFLASENETPTEAAIRFCVSCPQITIALVGFTTKEHIDIACRVATNCKPFTQTDIDRVKEHVSANMNSLCTGCGYCMNNLCPKDIPIANYMQSYNEKLLQHKSDKEMAERVIFQHEWGYLADRRADAGDCTRCGECERACTQHLDIIDRLGEMAGWEKRAKRRLRIRRIGRLVKRLRFWRF
ncbi:MAG: aldo/keto reductase [Planctomycetota bacterium]|nr:MAG: aldo/keto reductase [Planctomycetota bacterium]